MIRYTTLLLALLLGLLSGGAAAQKATLSITGQEISGSDFTFTIVITASDGDIYLGNSDFILTFNNDAFANPLAARTGDGNFGTESGVPVDALFTQRSYSNATATSISGNTVRINLAGPNPGSSGAFNTGVAKFPDGSSVSFGTFTISGYKSGQTVDLEWNGGATQLSTIVLPSLNEVPLELALLEPETILPVELIGFTAEKKDKKSILLSWKTASESQNAGFDVLHSTDAIEWSELHFMPGHGTTQETQSYQYAHEEAAPGANYYRLRQIDWDDDYEYSHIVMVALEDNLPETFRLFPNPASSGVQVQLSGYAGRGEIRVFDLTGRLVHRQMMDDGSHTHSLSFDSLPGGTYLVQLKAGNQSYTERLVLQR